MKAIDKYIKAKFKIKSEVRVELIKRIIYISIGVLIMILCGEEREFVLYISIAASIFSAYNLLLIIGMSQSLVYDFFPLKNVKENKKTSKAMNYFYSYMFLGGLVPLMFEINKISNTINGMELFWKSSIIGIFLAFLVSIVLKKVNPSIFLDSDLRINLYAGLFVGLFLLCPAIASFINHFNLNGQVKYQTFKILDKGDSTRKGISYTLFLDMGDNNEEKFEIPENFYPKVRKGDNIILGSKKGNLGYDFVVEFYKK
jgi:hypothetical protein